MSSTYAQDMAHNLHVWLMNEMQYDASGSDGYRMIPTPENLAELMCGQLQNVWKYLMDNVYGPHSTHAIKGNLQLCQSRSGTAVISTPEEKSLQNRKATLLKNLQQTKFSLSHLNSEVCKLAEEIIHKKSAVLERREAVRREQRLAAGLRLQADRCQAETSRTGRLSQQLAALADGGEPALDADGLESACMRQIGEATDLLAGHIDRSLEQAPTADSLARAERAIRTTVRRCSPAEILRSLAGLQQRAGLELARRLQRADPQTDTDTDRNWAKPDGDEVMCKIQRAVDELHALHVTWRITEVTALSEVKALRHQIDELQTQLASDEVGSADWSAHLGAAAGRGRLAAMQTAVRQLNTEVASLAETRAALEQRYAAIVRNEEAIEKNKSHIQLLVALGRDSLTLTRSAQQRAAAAAQRQLTPLLDTLLDALRQLTDDVSREAEAVTRRLLEDIRWIVVDGGPVRAPLPLRRLQSPDSALLDCRLRSGEAQLLALLADRWARQRGCADAAALAELRAALSTAGGDHAEQLEEARRRVENQMEHERTTLMPQLEKLFVNMSQIGGALKHARTALQNWTDQPARAVCQHVQHAGLPLKRWEQRYMAAAAGRSVQSAGRPPRQ